MGTNSSHFYVAGDIGGTYTRFALLQSSPDGFQPVSSVRLKTAEVDTLSQALVENIRTFRDQISGAPIAGICLSAAGPVHDNVCRLTNVPWVIDGNELEETVQTPVLVINDFSAICYGVPLLRPTDREELVEISAVGRNGTARAAETAAVVGAGTGLGVGFLFWSADTIRAFPSEAGHADFAPFDPESERLWHFVSERLGTVPDVEQFISGQGLANISDFMHREHPQSAALSQIAAYPTAEKPSLLAAAAAEDEAAAAAMRLFVKMYGRYCGNVALHFLPYRGVYLAGGIAAKNLRWFEEEPSFMDAFCGNYLPNMQAILSKTPVYVITEPSVSYIGAARAVATQRVQQAPTNSA